MNSSLETHLERMGIRLIIITAVLLASFLLCLAAAFQPALQSWHTMERNEVAMDRKIEEAWKEKRDTVEPQGRLKVFLARKLIWIYLKLNEQILTVMKKLFETNDLMNKLFSII